VDYFMFVDLDDVLPRFKAEPATCVSACGVIRAIRTTSATHVSRGISAWGALMSLILPTFLLLKDSAVSLPEQDIVESRPGLRQIPGQHHAFIPLPHRDRQH